MHINVLKALRGTTVKKPGWEERKYSECEIFYKTTARLSLQKYNLFFKQVREAAFELKRLKRHNNHMQCVDCI